MLIAKYIGDLLFDYECVVIPGLGGFIVNDLPASINYNTHYFKPPFREVMFNPYLRTNDGLLVNYIAKEENLIYQNAKKKIDAFAIACQQALNSGKQIKFDKVGTLRKDGNDKIIFIQDTSINYNPDSFGLSPFISPATHKVTDEERIKKVIKKVKTGTDKATAPSAINKDDKRKDRTPYNTPIKAKTEDGKILVARRRSPYRSQFYFILLLLLAMLAGWGVMNKNIVAEYYTQYGSKIPVFYNNAGSYIANNVEILPIKELSNSASALWLVNFFNKDNTKDNTTSLSNDDLTFKDSKKNSETKSTNQTGNTPEKFANDKAEEAANNNTTLNDEPAAKEVIETISEPDMETVPIVEEKSSPQQSITQPKTVAKDEQSSNEENNMKESSPHYSYFIIAGSFKNHNNAIKFVKELQNRGYVAIVAGTNKYGMTRVAYAGFNSIEEALQQLTVIRQHQNPSAWIMRK